MKMRRKVLSHNTERMFHVGLESELQLQLLDQHFVSYQHPLRTFM